MAITLEQANSGVNYATRKGAEERLFRGQHLSWGGNIFSAIDIYQDILWVTLSHEVEIF